MSPFHLVTVFVAASAAGQAKFAADVVSTSNVPASLSIADLNGDGVAEALLTDLDYPQALLVSPNPLQSPSKIEQSTSFKSSLGLLTDINGDGRPDEVFCAWNSPKIEVRLNISGLVFGGAVQSNLSSPAEIAATGDLNGDGIADLALAGSVPPTAQIGFGSSIGSLTFGSSVALGSANEGIAMQDFDGDGFLELAVAEAAGKLVKLFDSTSSDPYLSLSFAVTTIHSPRGLAAGDMDADGRPDLAIGLLGNGGVGALLSSLGFASGAPPVLIPVDDQTYAVQVASLVPGAPPSIFALGSSSRVWKCDFLGGSQFSKAGVHIPGLMNSFEMGDSNQDAIQDLYFESFRPPGLMVLPLDSQGLPSGIQRIDVGYAASDVLAMDVNADGWPDLLGSSRSYVGVPFPVSQISAALGSASGFQPAIQSGSGVILGPSTSLAAGDLNGDGLPDVIQDATHVITQILTGNGDGTFSLKHHIQQSGVSAVFPMPFPPAIADVTGDGIPEALSVSYQKQLKGYSNLYSSGPPTALDLRSWGFEISSFALADADLDGDLDLYASGVGQSGIQVDLWNGTGFTPASYLPLPAPVIRDIEVCDYTRDGVPDLVMLHGGLYLEAKYATNMFGLKGLAGGLLTYPTLMGLPTLANSSAIELADMDADGTPELLTVNSAGYIGKLGGSIMVARVGANGVATISNVIAGTESMHDVEVIDFDLDGRMDVAFASGNPGKQLWAFTNLLPDTPGVATAGEGTPGCLGFIRMAVHGTAEQGQPLRLSATQVASGVGLGIVSGAPEFQPTDPFSLGLSLHVSLATSDLLTLDFPEPLGGTSTLVIPALPVSPTLSANRWYLQTIWVGDPKRGDTCSQATIELQSSNLLTISL